MAWCGWRGVLIQAQPFAGCSSDIPLELCLSSNVITESVASYADHHFSAFHSGGEQLLGCFLPCGRQFIRNWV